MKKILVTGGAGFIGSHLVRRLVEEGNEVLVTDTLLRGNKIDKEILPSVTLLHHDIRDAEAMMRITKGCEIIYHFAAILGVDIVADNPVETMETEIIGMKNIAHASIVNGVDKLIYASTSGVYGHSAIEKSITEDVYLDPRTSYAIAKRFNEIYLKAQYEEKGLKSISLRLFNVYGKKQDNRMVIPRFIEQAMRKRPITVFGDGEQTRDFTYIDDTIRACLLLANKVNGCDIYNIANEKEHTIGFLAETIKKLTNSTSEITYFSAPKKRYDFEVERRLGSSQKLFNAVKYKPQTELEDGLKKILEGFSLEA
jgi:UDP-glucose 4-epimerase